MKKKHWQVSVFDKTSETIQDDTLYTTDTEVYLTFELVDKDFKPDSATVTIYNIYGTVTISENADIVNGIVNYEIPEDAIGHQGGWKTQVVFTKDNEDYTTTVIEFDVDGHLLDNNKPTIVYIENWNSFIKHGERLIDDWEQLEKIRQANERKRERAESVRQNEFETNETSRQVNELVREENELVRESAESVRVSNEEKRELNEDERISKDSERDSKIEGLEEDVVVNVTNTVLNGDFSHGKDNWRKDGGLSSSFEIIDDVAVNTEVTQNKSFITGDYLQFTNGNKIYVSFNLKFSDFTNVRIIRVIGGVGNNPPWSTVTTQTNNEFNNYSVVVDWETHEQIRIETQQTAVTPNVVTSLKSLLAIDLTTTFGKDNEPTAEEMDKLLEQFPNSWFDGTVNVNNSRYMMTMFLKELTKLNNAITTLGGNI